MCDYSLHLYPNRLAVDGEELVVYRFGGTSLGLASRVDIERMERRRGDSRRLPLWTRLKLFFQAQRELEARVCAVCIPPGAQLMLRDIPAHLQRELDVSEVQEVRFVEVTAEAHTYRDAIRFNNGRQVLLQTLCEGQRVTVMSLDAQSAEEPEGAELMWTR